jgi:hypothetical protein
MCGERKVGEKKSIETQLLHRCVHALDHWKKGCQDAFNVWPPETPHALPEKRRCLPLAFACDACANHIWFLNNDLYLLKY